MGKTHGKNSNVKIYTSKNKKFLRLVEFVCDEIVMEHNYWISQGGWMVFSQKISIDS
jgi:hypothetical protein